MRIIGPQPISGKVGTSAIADDAITEAKVANDAISITEMKAGTDGNVISYDASGDPVAIATGNDGQVLTSTGAGSPPAFETLPSGGVVKQQVITLKQDFILLTGQVYNDDTVPQKTEGAELMTRAITPNDSANILVIEGIVNCGFTGNGASAGIKILGLFQDTTANALATATVEDTTQGSANGRFQIIFRHRMAAGTTSATTFKVRLGSSSSPYEVSVNDRERGGGGYDFGGSQLMTHIMITEYAL